MQQRDNYAHDPESAKVLVAQTWTTTPEQVDPAERAAWTIVANVILNLDETITKN